MNATYQLILETAIGILLVSVILVLVYAIRRVTVKPLPRPDGSELYTIIAASGHAEQLEQTVKGLLMLNKSGELRSKIIITDCGMEETPRKVAELLAKDTEEVLVRQVNELAQVLEENGWTEKS